jgi:DNA-binding response OmpR family regulator
MTFIKHILVVEDDPDIRDILMDLFTDVGFDTTTAENATIALAQVKMHKFDLITLDLRLPDMTGNEFLEELAHSSFANPIVVISANLENLKPNSMVKAALNKPFDMNNLLNIIEQYV